MSNIKKSKIWQYVTISAILLILLALGTFFDLQISQKLASLPKGFYHSPNIFGRFFETVGEMPIYLITSFAAILLYQNSDKRKKNALTMVLKIVCIAISLALSYYMFYKLFKYLSQHFGFEDKLGSFFDYLAYFFLGVIYTLLLIFLTKKIQNDFLNKTFKLCLIILLTALFSQILSNILKIFAGRYRYCTMNTIDDFSLFTPWYIFNGKRQPSEEMKILGVASDGLKSFPSGHTAAAAMVIVFTAIPGIFEKYNNKRSKVIINISCWLYIALVMFSRIVMGKHFLSDVVIGLTETLLSYVCATYLINKFFVKYAVTPLGNLTGTITEEAL